MALSLGVLFLDRTSGLVPLGGLSYCPRTVLAETFRMDESIIRVGELSPSELEALKPVCSQAARPALTVAVGSLAGAVVLAVAALAVQSRRRRAELLRPELASSSAEERERGTIHS
ncbi:hypothetical protein [Actinopolymorpha alba]|uniref:hypothetical protein n=1 Tax=Actinopolymorpha alba TaxID=533267 RepID=UPI00038069FA|nr:hypothetical protein [Actinopolymorpha alba]